MVSLIKISLVFEFGPLYFVNTNYQFQPAPAAPVADSKREVRILVKHLPTFVSNSALQELFSHYGNLSFGFFRPCVMTKIILGSDNFQIFDSGKMVYFGRALDFLFVYSIQLGWLCHRLISGFRRRRESIQRVESAGTVWENLEGRIC